MIGDQVNGKRVWGEAGRFQVLEDGMVIGPRQYLQETDLDKVLKGNPIIMGGFAPGATIHQLVAVALQTDYAGWLGMKELVSRSS